RGSVPRWGLAVAGPVLLSLVVSARLTEHDPVSPHAHLFVAQELVFVVGIAVISALAVATRIDLRADVVSCVVGALVALEIASTSFAANRMLAVRSATLWVGGLLVFLVARGLGVGTATSRAARDVGLGG